MTYEQAVEHVKAAGLRVNNTFQSGESWRANVYDDKTNTGFCFGIGATPAEALDAALKGALAELKIRPVVVERAGDYD